MSDNLSSFGVVMCLFFVCMFGFMFIEIGVLQPGRIEIAEIQLERDGISIQDVTINSPVVYFEIDNYDQFKELLNDRNCTEIYSYGFSYYIFNEDLTIGWRISYQTIYEVVGH